MRHIAHHTGTGKALVLMFLLALAGPAAIVCAATDITGSWEMTMDFGGHTSFATLTITPNADGSLAGKWGSAQLSNVKFDGRKLTFTRTVRFGDNEFSMDYAGSLQDGRIIGGFSTDNGEFEANGARKKPFPTAVGQWDMQYQIGDRQITGRFTISQKADGTLEGKWTGRRGESTISNVRMQDGKLSFDRTSSYNGNEFKTSFEGTVQSDKLTGTFRSDRGEIAATGQRFGAAVIGDWGLTVTSDRGTFPGRIVVYPDLTGRYELFGGEIPMKTLQFEGGQLTFAVEVGFGDQTSEINFKGKVEGTNLKGQTTSSWGTSEITGKKVEKISPVFGVWEFTREGRDGTPRTSTLLLKSDLTGAYKMRDNEFPVTGLAVNGDQVSFKIVLKFNDNEFPMDFKGKVEGGTLKGEFITSRGSREAVGKKVE